MKTLLTSSLSLVLLVSSILAVHSAIAADKVTKSHKTHKTKSVTKNVSPKAKSSNLGTSFSFDPASVRGKYKIASQGIATVEDEKLIDDLLGVRKSFKDREEQELSRQ